MTSLPHHLLSQRSVQSATQSQTIGTIIISRKLGGNDERISVKGGDVVTLSGTDVRVVTPNEDGPDSITPSTLIDPDFDIVLTWPSSAPDSDTIRVRPSDGTTWSGSCASRYPHPTRPTRLQPNENIFYFEPDGISMHTVFGTESSYIELRPAELIWKSGKESKRYFIGTGDKIWAETEQGNLGRIPLTMDCEYLITGEECDE